MHLEILVALVDPEDLEDLAGREGHQRRLLLKHRRHQRQVSVASKKVSTTEKMDAYVILLIE